MSNENWQAIGRGKNGWFAAKPGCSGTGGNLEYYVKEGAEGALVYDGDNADMSEYVRHVMSGPMLDCSLEPFGENRFTNKDRETAKFLMPALEEGYKALAQAAQDQNYSGLDSVGIGIYAALLRNIKGVRFGKVINGSVVWEE